MVFVRLDFLLTWYKYNSLALLPNLNNRFMNAHEIDYRIFGEEMQFVQIELDPYETVVAESGSFMSMDQGVEMKTIFGAGSGQDEDF